MAELQRALQRIVAEPVEELRQLELLRLDQLWMEAWRVLRAPHVMAQNGKIVRGDDRRPLPDDAPVLQAIDRCLAIMQRRARLLGLDAPTASRVNVITMDALDAEIARLEAELRSLDPERAAEFEALRRELENGGDDDE